MNIFCQFWTYFIPCSSVSIVNFQPVKTHWARLNVYFAVINWYVLRRWNKFQKDLVFFWSQQILNYFFWKKWNFEIIPITFTCFGKKIRFRRHLSHLLKLTNLFSKNMSKFRANNHVLFVLIFYSQIKKMISDTFAMKSIDFLNWKIPKDYFFSINEYHMSILILFQICSYDSIILLFFVLKMTIKIFFDINP